jgi:integrase/recombinase XerD
LIAAFYRAKGEGKAEAVVYAKNLSREQRQLLMAMAELTQMQPQDDLDKGEITFAELWQENVIHLECMVATVWELPEKLGVMV